LYSIHMNYRAKSKVLIFSSSKLVDYNTLEYTETERTSSK